MDKIEKIIELDNINGYERVIHFKHKSPALEGIVAIHRLINGCALGGCRFLNYSSFEAGLEDVLALAKSMTYKNAVMDLPYGGGKAVIFDNAESSRHDILRVFSSVLNELGGQYITTDDVGTSVEDMYYLRKYSKFARGRYWNGRQIPATAYGVYQAIKATLKYHENLDDLCDIKVVIQGLGKVGYSLCEFLYNEKCKLYVNDIDSRIVEKAVQNFEATPINFDETQNLEADVFSPCAFRDSVTESILSKLEIKYIVGGENNPIASSNVENLLEKKNIVYVPDYVANAGGVIDIACEGKNYSKENVYANVGAIYDKTIKILRVAGLENKTPLEISNKYVNDRLKKHASGQNENFCPKRNETLGLGYVEREFICVE